MKLIKNALVSEQILDIDHTGQFDSLLETPKKSQTVNISDFNVGNETALGQTKLQQGTSFQSNITMALFK